MYAQKQKPGCEGTRKSSQLLRHRSCSLSVVFLLSLPKTPPDLCRLLLTPRSRHECGAVPAVEFSSSERSSRTSQGRGPLSLPEADDSEARRPKRA